MSNLQEAFREAARREFAMVPEESELDHVFSLRFERKMRRIIRAQVHGYWMMVNTAAKRVAVAVAIIVTLLTSAMAIKPIRERVIKFFIDVYEDYFEIHFGEEKSWDLPERTEPMLPYTLTDLPDGYEETDFRVFDGLLWTEWTNESGNSIILKQEPGTNEITLDNKKDYMDRILVDDVTILVHDTLETKIYIWEYNEYTFYLSIHEEITTDATVRIIKSLVQK